MNYFEWHISDYQRKTAHLSLTEHGAYSLMLQANYASERPLPGDKKVLYRLLRAESKQEKAAIDSIVRQFWDTTPDGLVNKRASEKIVDYREWVEKQRANGKRGGRRNGSNGQADAKPSQSDGQAKPGDSDLRLRLRPPTTHTHTTSEGAPTGSAGGVRVEGKPPWKPPTEAELTGEAFAEAKPHA